jgi:hypothetical protein
MAVFLNSWGMEEISHVLDLKTFVLAIQWQTVTGLCHFWRPC